MSDLEKIIHELRMNCDHEAANLIEQLQQRLAELEAERPVNSFTLESVSETTADVVRDAFVKGYCQGATSYCGRPLQINGVFLNGARYHAEKEYPSGKDGE